MSPVQMRSTFNPAATTPGIAVVTVGFSGPVTGGAAGAWPKIETDARKHHTIINMNLVFIDSPLAIDL
jgi:hypothetical protein